MPSSKQWMEDSDQAAVERVRAGDSDGFRLLVERHSRAVFRLAYRMTGNQSDADDVVQETFLKAYKQIGRFEERASFSTWIYRIAANCALDLLRSRKRHEDRCEKPSAEEMPDALATAAASDPLPDRQVYAGQVRGRINDALAALTAQERTAFVLRHFEGHSIEEIGHTLGLAESATKNSIFRAVQKLRRALEPVVSAAR